MREYKLRAKRRGHELGSGKRPTLAFNTKRKRPRHDAVQFKM